jgi:hypothetical protein
MSLMSVKSRLIASLEWPAQPPAALTASKASPSVLPEKI